MFEWLAGERMHGKIFQDARFGEQMNYRVHENDFVPLDSIVVELAAQSSRGSPLHLISILGRG